MASFEDEIVELMREFIEDEPVVLQATIFGDDSIDDTVVASTAQAQSTFILGTLAGLTGAVRRIAKEIDELKAAIGVTDPNDDAPGLGHPENTDS